MAPMPPYANACNIVNVGPALCANFGILLRMVERKFFIYFDNM